MEIDCVSDTKFAVPTAHDDTRLNHIERRTDCDASIRNSENFLVAAAYFELADLPDAPDPYDWRISKRGWEKRCEEWRHALLGMRVVADGVFVD